jgi:hypothetical protein
MSGSAQESQKPHLSKIRPHGLVLFLNGASDGRLDIPRHFADAIVTAARKGMSRREQGRIVSAISALTRASLEIGPYRRAA